MYIQIPYFTCFQNTTIEDIKADYDLEDSEEDEVL